MCLLLACCRHSAQPAQAQEASVAQPYMAPLFLNPAYSGMEGVMRLGATCQYRWGQIDHPYMLYAAYADYYFAAFGSGVGLCALSERQGGGALTQTSLGASYAYNLRIAERTFLRFGIQALLDVTAVNAAKLTFPDMLGAYGGAAPAGSAYAPSQRSDFDMATGIVFSHRIFYVGAALHNLLEAPAGEVAGQLVTTPRKLMLHGGCNIAIPLYGRRYSYYRGSSTALMLSPNVICGVQGAAQAVALGGYIGMKGFSGGFFYKANSRSKAVFYSICAAYSSSLFSLAYSFDFGTVSKAMPQSSPDVHEVSLGFKIRQPTRSSYFQNRRNSNQKIQNTPYINYL